MIYYCSMPTGNVGDDLNELIWKEIVDFDKLSQSDVIVGIGSILNDKMPSFTSKNIYVIGSGIGYGNLPEIDENWHFIAVRGKETRKALKLPINTPLLDSAYLADFKQFIHLGKKEFNFGYVPHVQSLEKGDWLNICKLAGIELIDPRLDVKNFVNKLSRCEKVMCEAMHGAIFADMCRIPWLPIKAYSHINEKKWADWLSAFDERIPLNRIHGVWKKIEVPKKQFFKNLAKKTLLFFYDTDWVYNPIYNESSSKNKTRLVRELESLKKAEYYLNCEKKIEIAKSKVYDSIKLHPWSKI